MPHSKSLRTLLVLALAALATSHPQPQVETATLVASSTDRPWFQTPSLPTSTSVTSADTILGNHPHSTPVTPEPLPSPSSTNTGPSLVTYTDLALSTVVTATVVATAPTINTYTVGVPPPMNDIPTASRQAPAATISSDGFVQVATYTGDAPSLFPAREAMWCFVGSILGLVGGLELL